MTHISDEILNKYIDNEIEGRELSELNEHLKFCASCLARLKAQRIVDQQLRRMETFQVSGDFTQNMMKKIERMSFSYKPKKSYFFRFIVALFLILTAGILTAAILALKASGPASSAEPAWYKTVIETAAGKFSNLLSSYNSLFTGRDFSVLGSGLAFIILVSIYIVYESFKGAKGRLR
ncbi:MAG: anti-sigma factor family protein [Syntrophomonadaceae bacterium]